MQKMGLIIAGGIAGVVALGAPVFAAETAEGGHSRLKIATNSLSTDTHSIDNESAQAGPLNWLTEPADAHFDGGSLNRVGAEYQFASRHKIQFGHYSVENLTPDLAASGGRLPLSAASSQSFDSRITELGYSYSFVQTSSLNVAGIAGVHYLDTSLLANDDNREATVLNRFTADGPSPLFGFDVQYQVTRNLHAGSRAQMMTFGGQQFAGSMYDLKLTVGYSLLKNLDLAVDYNVVDFDLSVDSQDFNGDVGMEYDGYRAYGVFRF